jgi:hypothetical protein
MVEQIKSVSSVYLEELPADAGDRARERIKKGLRLE